MKTDGKAARNRALGVAGERALLLSVFLLVFLLFHLWGNRSSVAMESHSLVLWIGSQWLNSDGNYDHGWIMPLVSLWFVWSSRDALSKARSKSSLLGLGVVIAGLLLHWAALRGQQPRVSLVALVGVLWGIPYYLYGRGVSRLLLFPCGYLLLCFTSYLMVSF